MHKILVLPIVCKCACTCELTFRSIAIRLHGQNNYACFMIVQFSQDKSMYDATHELEYLEMVFCETMRMYPPAPA